MTSGRTAGLAAEGESAGASQGLTATPTRNGIVLGGRMARRGDSSGRRQAIPCSRQQFSCHERVPSWSQVACHTDGLLAPERRASLASPVESAHCRMQPQPGSDTRVPVSLTGRRIPSRRPRGLERGQPDDVSGRTLAIVRMPGRNVGQALELSQLRRQSGDVNYHCQQSAARPIEVIGGRTPS